MTNKFKVRTLYIILYTYLTGSKNQIPNSTLLSCSWHQTTKQPIFPRIFLSLGSWKRKQTSNWSKTVFSRFWTNEKFVFFSNCWSWENLMEKIWGKQNWLFGVLMSRTRYTNENWWFWPIGTCFVCLSIFYYFQKLSIYENSEFLVSVLVVGSGEQKRSKTLYYLGDYGHIWSFFCFTNLVMEDQRTLRGHTDFFFNQYRFTSGFRNSLHQCDLQISFYLFFFVFCFTNGFVEIFALFFQSWSQFSYGSRFKWCIQSYIA